MTYNISYALQTDMGQVRKENRDAVYSFVAPPSEKNPNSNFGLFIVADGMGDEAPKASALMVEICSQYVLEVLYSQWNEGSLSVDSDEILSTLRRASSKANDKVLEATPEAGGSMTLILVLNDFLYGVHVGANRAYLVSESKVEKLTRDHILLCRMGGFE